MMKINVVAIAKPEHDCYHQLCERFIKMSGRWAKIESVELFNARVTKAQELGEVAAKRSYEELLMPWVGRGLTIALDPKGIALETLSFAHLLEDRQEVSFLIGGAFGHSAQTLQASDKIVRLSDLTMSHKVAKVILFEQIYRALSIIHHHPYHK